MELNEYQKQAAKTMKNSSNNLQYLGLGLCGEAGEVAEKLKKQIRDGTYDIMGLAREVGDVLWYVAGICTYLKIPLAEVANINLDKLQDRAKRGKISGSGDNR